MPGWHNLAWGKFAEFADFPTGKCARLEIEQKQLLLMFYTNILFPQGFLGSNPSPGAIHTMKIYLTWGIGYGSKPIAEKNAQLDASINHIETDKLDSLEIERAEVVQSKKELSKLKGKHKGIVLEKCIKGEAAVALALGFSEDKIYLGIGKASSANKALKEAIFEVEKIAREKKIEFEKVEHLVADASAEKDSYSCAIVGLIINK